jgi:hypothetical protein
MPIIYGLIFMLVLLALLIGALKLADYWEGYPHIWKYRNPYDRTCETS